MLQDSPLHNHVERVLQIVDFSTFAKVDDVDLAEKLFLLGLSVVHLLDESLLLFCFFLGSCEILDLSHNRD